MKRRSPHGMSCLNSTNDQTNTVVMLVQLTKPRSSKAAISKGQGGGLD